MRQLHFTASTNKPAQTKPNATIYTFCSAAAHTMTKSPSSTPQCPTDNRVPSMAPAAHTIITMGLLQSTSAATTTVAVLGWAKALLCCRRFRYSHHDIIKRLELLLGEMSLTS